MKIAVIGASGWLGGSIAREATARGHEVTAIGRDRGKLLKLPAAGTATCDVRDVASTAAAIEGHEVVVSAVTDRSTPDRSLIPASARTLLAALPEAGVPRLAFCGGGGSLEVEPGVRAVDRPGFPEEYRAEALAQAEALAILKSAPPEIDWTYLSPPPAHLEPGDRTGRPYRVKGGGSPVIGADGDSRITSGDFAAAMVDEIEQHRFSRQQFTAAY